MSDENEEPVRPAYSSRIAQRVPRTAEGLGRVVRSRPAGVRPQASLLRCQSVSTAAADSRDCGSRIDVLLARRMRAFAPCRLEWTNGSRQLGRSTTEEKKAECLRTVLRWHIITVALAFCACTIVTAAPSNTICARHRNVRCVESSRCQLAPTAARHTFDNITCGPCEGNVSRATIVTCRTHRRAPPCIARALVRR